MARLPEKARSLRGLLSGDTAYAGLCCVRDRSVENKASQSS